MSSTLPGFEQLAESAAVLEAKAKRAETLAIARALGPGPVYQGVSKQIRRLTASGKYAGDEQRVDPVEQAGTIAAARQLARAIDRATGHNVSGWVANGRDVSPMFERLESLLLVLTDGDASDPFAAWLSDDVGGLGGDHADPSKVAHPAV